MAAVRPLDARALPGAALRREISAVEASSIDALQVGCIGAVPDWLGYDGAESELRGITIEPVAAEAVLNGRAARSAFPPVLHVDRSGLDILRRLRHAAPESSLVLDLTAPGNGNLGPRASRRARVSDVILVGSLSELRELRRRYPRLTPRTALMQPPVDLDAYVPESRLARSRPGDLLHTRRAYGLDAPVVLHPGPLTAAGGLDLAIESVHLASRRVGELLLVALAHGDVDRTYLAGCDRLSRRLGQRLLVVSPRDADLPLWYAIATVVCLPAHNAETAEPARLAAAAGRAFVGSATEAVLEHVIEGETGYVVSIGDVDELEAALTELLSNERERQRLGDAARRRAERTFAPAPAARRLAGVWRAALEVRAAKGSRAFG